MSWAFYPFGARFFFDKLFTRFKGQLRGLFFTKFRMSYRYNIQNTDKPYLFSLIQTQIKIVRTISVLFSLLHVD